MTEEAYEAADDIIDDTEVLDFSGVDFFANVKTKHEDRPIGGILFGEPGSGKSSLAAQFPKAIFVTGPKDRGVETLKQYNQIPKDTASLAVSCHEEFLAFLRYVVDQENVPYKYLIVDQFSEFEGFLFDYVCRVEFEGDWTAKGFYNFQQGYDRSIDYLQEVVELFEEIRDKGIGVIVLAHSVVKSVDHPVHGRYDRFILDCHHKMAAVLKKWSDTILFIDSIMDIVEPEKGKQQKRRAVGGQMRVLRVTQTAAYDAKNRFGLTESISGGNSAAELYAALKAKMVAAKKGTKSN